MSTRRGPHVRLFQRACETATLLPLSAWESLGHALDTSAEWWEGETIYGATVRIRVSTIADIHYVTQAALDAAREDDEQETYPN